MSGSEWAARSECIIEELRNRMNSLENRMNAIENRMNVQIGLTVAMWLSMVGFFVTLLLR